MEKAPQLRLEMSSADRHRRRSAGLKVRILIVVADRLVGRQLARMLTKKGYQEVRAVSDVDRALVLSHEYGPGIVFLDLELPGGAYELARALQRQSGRDAHRLIALTPAIDHSTRERARHAGFERWLVTPVVQDELDDLLTTDPARLTE